MVPAAALAAELMKRGHRVALVSDERGVRFPGLFEGVQTHIIPAGRDGRNPILWAKAAKSIWDGRAMAMRLFETFRPAAVIGFGGYPALPALLAAFSAKVPTAVHEQNAVLGRVNRLVAGKVDAIATSYASVQRLAVGYRDKTHLV
ncbi:MAG TPA: glycosyltransferase, partial [Sphingomicrobium sp.]